VGKDLPVMKLGMQCIRGFDHNGKFNVHWSVHRKNILIYGQQDATLHSLSGNYSTCFEWYHPKHVEQFPDKINCVRLHLVGYILEYTTENFLHRRDHKARELLNSMQLEGGGGDCI
jgi:hypothetical protein